MGFIPVAFHWFIGASTGLRWNVDENTRKRTEKVTKNCRQSGRKNFTFFLNREERPGAEAQPMLVRFRV
jgi:hypothetical protein